MTTEHQEKTTRENSAQRFAMRTFPWIIAAGVFLVYILTLNHWVSLKSLPVVAKIAGWDWHPQNVSWRPSPVEPLHFILTYPLRWLSGQAQFIALNLFSAVCAALTLALLARSVALLPQDRTREQRQRETGKFSLLNLPLAWLPAFAAVLVCGLQLLFWENAVAHTGEMLNLLIFAYVIRCLLEFRISKKESWLMKMALVYGLGVTNNWAMIGFFPFFVVALIWIKGMSFFEFRFITRMLLFGLIGLSLYLLFPLIAALTPGSGETFFQTLLGHWRYQKSYVFDMPFRQITVLRARLVVISLTSLLPLLMIGIRWPSFRGDISAIGGMINVFVFRLMHLFFLGILLSLFFDPPYSASKLGFELQPYLTFYYLSALAMGYFLGYALLVFGREPVQAWARSTPLAKMVNRVIWIVVCVAGIAVPVAVAKKNFPVIHATNGDVVKQFAQLTANSLPERDAVVLSDDPKHLYLLRAAFSSMGKPAENVFVETGSLENPRYHQYLHKQFPKIWPDRNSTNSVAQIELVLMLNEINKTNRLFYAHPSFGYYFEKFYAIPHRLAYELKPFTDTSIEPPPLSDEVISDNEKFWNDFAKNVLPPLPALGKKSSEVTLINTYYSRSLNSWGAHLQKAKRLKEAGAAFAEAVTLNPDNAVAEINRQFNLNLQRGEIRPIQPDDEQLKKLKQFGSLQAAMQWNGPLDERDFCIQVGTAFGLGNNLRQSAQYFLRALDFSPKNLDARLGLAKTYIEMRRPDDALKLISEIRGGQNLAELSPAYQTDLLRTEALAYLAKNDFPTAEKILINAQKAQPKNEDRLALLAQIYLATGHFINAMETVEKQLKIDPQSAAALFTKGIVQMNLKDYASAISIFDRVLGLQPKNFDALLNRAIANLQSGNLPAAKRDYESLLESVPKANAYPIYFRLGDLAEKQNDKSAAIKNYKTFLKKAPADAPERAEAQKRIDTLEKS